MRKFRPTIAGAAAGLLAGITGSGAMTLPREQTVDPSLVQKVHSLYEAKEKLDRLGYYNIQTERASLPYSFIACKRGVRYHVHMNYYGDFEQVDPVGACRSYGDDYGRRDFEERPYYAQRFRPQRFRRYDY